jgi:hypothetical protein
MSEKIFHIHGLAILSDVKMSILPRHREAACFCRNQVDSKMCMEKQKN